jgi:two-component system response regulator WspF
VRIAIVNDLEIAAEGLRRVIAEMPGHRVAWIARDGAEAVEKCKTDRPDLVLMDLIMPVMDGIEATRRIMTSTPCAILVVTATVQGNSTKIFEALGAGALDAVQTPLLSLNGPAPGASALKFKIETLGRSAVEKQPEQSIPQTASCSLGSARDRLVVIGASAGGPAALATVLSGLPSHFPASIIIVQHIDSQFVASMVAWLKERSQLPIRVARQGERLQPGTVLVAGTNNHLTLLGPDTVGYTTEPRESNHRPSIDVLFDSVVRHWRGEITGVLLSGMGRDGASGLKRLRDSGAFTIAQDSMTSAVYGMPKAAAELKAAVKILPVNEIAGELIGFAAALNL